MMVTIVSLWISCDVARPRFTLATSPPIPADWRGLTRCTRGEWRDLKPGKITSIALCLS